MGDLHCRGINNQVLKELERFVRDKYGKKHTVYGLTVERALREFLVRNVSGTARSYPRQLSDFEHPDDGMCSATHHKLYKVKQHLEEMGAWWQDKLPHAVVARYVKKEFGYDQRTIRKYVKEIYKMHELGG